MRARLWIQFNASTDHLDVHESDETIDVNLECPLTPGETVYISNLCGYDWEGHVGERKAHHMFSGGLQAHLPGYSVYMHPVREIK